MNAFKIIALPLCLHDSHQNTIKTYYAIIWQILVIDPSENCLRDVIKSLFLYTIYGMV